MLSIHWPSVRHRDWSRLRCPPSLDDATVITGTAYAIPAGAPDIHIDPLVIIRNEISGLEE
jgi:hypothetical protein